MLAGLPTEYKPLIFGLENSDTKLTTDYVKGILLQGAILDNKSEQASALFVKKKKNFKRVKCFNCGGPHFAAKCKKPKKDSDQKNNHEKVLFTSFYANGEENDWIIDSGASAHMCKNNVNLKNVREPSKKTIIVANNSEIKIDCVGDIAQTVGTENGVNDIVIKNVQYVPDFCVNLLSVSQMVKNNNTVVFSKKGCAIYNEQRKMIASGSLINDMFKLNTFTEKADTAFSAKTTANMILWHRRLGHVSISNMNFLKKTININDQKNFNCIVCAHCTG